MSVSVTTAKIKEAQAELERATGVTIVENPDGTTESVPGEFSCERLQALLDEYVGQVKDHISAQSEQIGDLMSQYAPILQIPSDPLKIIKWAKKVVTGMVSPKIAAAIELATDLAQLAGALAGLASAVANAAARLVDCITNAVFDAMKGIIDFAMQNAISLYDQANSIYENLKNQALEDLGYNELLALSDEMDSQIDSAMTQISSVENSVDQIQDAADVLGGLTIPAT